MNNTIISRIQQELQKRGLKPGGNPAKTWLMQKVRQLNPSGRDRMDIVKQREAQRNKAILGRFYFFFYDAKLKDKLPYWDRFPLVIPISQYHDGFLGLNLHYIPPKERLLLLRKLRQFATGPLKDEKTRLRLSYPLLAATKEAYKAMPCVKRYLANHIQSRVIEVPPSEWDIAAALPLQQFKSNTGTVNSQEVWDDSENMEDQF
jgi:hypothetical protein